MTLLHTFGKIAAARVLVAGLGKSDGFTVDKVRDLSANVARFLRGSASASTRRSRTGRASAGWTRRHARRRSPRARCSGLYQFDHPKKPNDDAFEVRR